MPLAELALALLLTSSSASATTPAAQTLAPVDYLSVRQTAFRAFDASDWVLAARTLEELTASYDQDALVSQALGRSNMKLKRWRRAVEQLERTLALGGQHPEQICYELAVSNAQLGSHREAFQWLDRALERGFPDRTAMVADIRLAPLLVHEQWNDYVPSVPRQVTEWTGGWRSDLDFLQEEVARLYVPQSGGASVQELQAELRGLSMNVPLFKESELPARVQRALATAGSTQTRIVSANSAALKKRLPVDLRWFPDGLFVIAASSRHQDLVGGRVTSIGFGRASIFESDLRQVVSRDNSVGITEFGPKYLTQPHILVDLDYADSAGSVKLIVEMQDHRQREAMLSPTARRLSGKLHGGSRTSMPGSLPIGETRDGLTGMVAGQRVYYASAKTSADKPPGLGKEAAWWRKLRTKFELKESTDLICDLRHRETADAQGDRELLRTLMSFELSQEGNAVYVLIGRGTLAPAHDLLADIERLTDAVLVGETTCSRPNRTGESATVRLPYSGLTVKLGCTSNQGSFAGDERLLVAPHVPVEQSIHEYFSSRDKVLGVTLDLIQSKRGR